ncbi:MAG: hypothetical protein Q7U53_07625 [Anaerolineaceae bacterium]|nr:hypothetical protein [Anaerolineaceae bacterium]
MKTKIIIFLTLILLSACNPIPEPIVPLPNQTPPINAQAKLELINFFVYLNHGKYEDAAFLYGGPYEVLEGYNPDIDPMNKAALLQSGCEINGLMCLQLYSASLIQQSSENEFVFQVSYRNTDGTEFTLGPCCGATEEEMPPIRLFEIRVSCSDNNSCQVLDLPPYVP